MCDKCVNCNCGFISNTTINSEQAGRDGLSTYDIAVKTGKFVGTQAEFVVWSKGSKGDKGDIGPAGTITGATASGLIAGATPTVTLGGTAIARTFAFGIPAGADGASAGFGTPTATVTMIAAGEPATCIITTSGPNTAKVFDFAFSIPSPV